MQFIVSFMEIVFLSLGLVAFVWLSAYGIVSWIRARVHHEHANNGTGEILTQAHDLHMQAKCEREIAEDRKQVLHAGR